MSNNSTGRLGKIIITFLYQLFTTKFDYYAQTGIEVKIALHGTSENCKKKGIFELKLCPIFSKSQHNFFLSLLNSSD
jgi:hypothetical protein